jgi:nucleotide-binding universal stress UspA family protein
MNTILAPTDLSKCADNAVRYAIRFAEKNKSHLIFFHSTFLHIPTRSSTKLYLKTVEAEKENKAKLLSDNIDRIYKGLSKKRNDKTSSLIVKYSPEAVTDIMQMLKKKSIDLVIMGTKGASGVKEVLIGSNTAKVISEAKVPIIAVPEKAEFTSIGKITYATDYHASDISALKKLIAFISPFKPPINVLHAANEELTPYTEMALLNQFKYKAKKNLKYPRLSFAVKYGKQVEKVLQEHIREEKPDLIAMSTKDRNLLEKLFGTSSTQKMAYHSQIPLLAFHHKGQ